LSPPSLLSSCLGFFFQFNLSPLLSSPSLFNDLNWVQPLTKSKVEQFLRNLENREKTRSRSASETKEEKEAQAMGKAKVLVVEDNLINQKVKNSG
jgi:hypothetical protein